MPVPSQTSRMTIVVSRALISLTAAAVAVTGCAQHHVVTAPIKIASAYVMQSTGANVVTAYLVIANSGPADRLLSVRSSAGGQVTMAGPSKVTLALSGFSVPGHSVTRLDPSGYHLEIFRSGRLHQGTDVTLTLVFAHAGTVRVPALVNNPATNNGGYLGP